MLKHFVVKLSKCNNVKMKAVRKCLSIGSFYPKINIGCSKPLKLLKLGQYSTKPNPMFAVSLSKMENLIGQFSSQKQVSRMQVFAKRQANMLKARRRMWLWNHVTAHYGRERRLVQKHWLKLKWRLSWSLVLIQIHWWRERRSNLARCGIEVETGICDRNCKTLNFGLLKALCPQVCPYVRLKIASSLDGRTAMASGESKWITGTAARQDVQHWRAVSAAVITGIQTVLADDCKT